MRAEEAFGDAICGCSSRSRDNVQANSAWGESGVVCMQLQQWHLRVGGIDVEA